MTGQVPDILIDEVVLGLASDADTARVEELALRDADVARRLEQARLRFMALDDTAPVLPIPLGFWDRLRDRLEDATPAQAARAARVVDLARARLRRWQGAAFGGMAAAALMAAMLGWTLLQSPEPAVVAVLLDADGEAVALIEGQPDNTTRVTLLERPDLPAGRVMQVWTKPDADGLPVSLGLLVSGRSDTLTVPGLPAPGASQLYEITAEPDGGSPTNLPTGPILGKGLAKEPVI
ncbi:anti-sigma factor [Paracoccus sp. 1_MG-2023]|uniref:anti-sigma factor n=1 Tax=unclassified Paracoccus (in: a-proteobacteria) TaxID=2688777 RepID=UPI001C096020|nr:MULTISPECIES: anti-sigma factor [unclassified Paracoccus (in: a-proteobacteria)]MBU2958279.1 anti-sigma factor [Paracoccus sp. C2R09]MDO6668406.1 anti-sigma factor [Paracoccus sp. 1_MG-2023]